MKKKYQYGLSTALLLMGLGAQAQNRPDGQPYSLGTAQSLLRQLEPQVTTGAAQRSIPTVMLRVSAAEAFTGKVNYRQDLSKTGEYVVGEIQGVPGSSFQVRVDGKEVEGNIVLRSSKKAYRYYTDAQGNASVQEVDINKVLCIDYNQPEGHQNPAPASASSTASRAAAVVSLQSFPGAKGCVLLDFDGQYVSGTPWNNGNPINAAPSGMSDTAIREFWELVSEDFRPFNLNVTTDEAVFNSYPKTMRRRCIITPTTTAAPGAGGVAYLGSFKWNDDTPCWEFMTSAKAGGEAASHEVGHTLGLSHDGRISPSEGYYRGQGNWAPIMGVGYYKPITQWSRGEYNSANQKQDDLAIMSGSTYNLGYRTDDHSNTTASATSLVRSGTSLSGGGIIERTTDQDFFVFTSGAGAISLNLNTVARHGNLDILARLYDSAGTLIGSYDAAGLNTSLSVNVAAGTYYLSVDGTGAANPATDGYSDYASLGTFTISGTAPVGGTTTPEPPTAFSKQLEAELADVNNGMVAETCSDTGGGQNMGYVTAGDNLVFNAVTIPTTGTYLIEYRVANGKTTEGTISSNLDGTVQLGNTIISPTGGWQTWTTVSKTVTLNAGTYNFGIYAQTGGYNINWIRISKAADALVATPAPSQTSKADAIAVELYPNPAIERLQLRSENNLDGHQFRIVDSWGRPVASGAIAAGGVDVAALKPGIYTITIVADGKTQVIKRFFK
ncbi:carbohydrate-binding protein [Hymenobacter terrenus]|uniref:carbohydrate-binding protein n=1 Tax=Hymenobacter terrenus TaxID=1629124 RepID=UPI000696A367|nr:carbohydrate-binding protein [Hymenobacter terrenus]